jgi:hypothetical protein
MQKAKEFSVASATVSLENRQFFKPETELGTRQRWVRALFSWLAGARNGTK